MTERRIGETFTADKASWTVYAIDPDGTVCSRFAGTASKTAVDATDYSQTCAYIKRGSHRRISRCDNYVQKGSRYCRGHQPR